MTPKIQLNRFQKWRIKMKFPRLPKALLKPPRGFKRPKVSDFVSDMERLGEQIAEDFKETITENIETNEYGFSLSESTIKQKKSDLPLVDTGELVDAIYRDGTSVSVKDTPRTDSSLTNLQLAIVQEYGTKDRHIPARPVWRKTYSDFRPSARKQVEEFFQKGEFKRVTDKKIY